MNRRRWNHLARDFDEIVCDITKSDDGGAFRKQVQRCLRLVRKGVLVDLGCGTGTFISRFGGAFKRAVGLDFSDRVLDEARARSAPENEVTWICGDVRKAPDMVGPRADLTVCLNVITSTSPQYRIAQWKSVVTVTKPRGHILVVVPAMESAYMIARRVGRRQAGLARATEKKGLVRKGRDVQKHYTEDEIEALFERLDLTLVSTQRIWYPWEKEGLDPIPGKAARTQPWDWGVIARRRSAARARR